MKNSFSLKQHNTFGINCIAASYIKIISLDQLTSIDFAPFKRLLILGGGSNMVLPDRFDGLVIEIDIKGFDIFEENEDYTILKIGGGELWDDFVRKAIDSGYCGFENLALIPGKVGAAPIQNIGAYGIEQEKYFHKVDVFDINNKEFLTVYKDDCNFGYRDSIFKNNFRNGYLVTNVYYKFPKIWTPNLDYKDVRDAINDKSQDEISPIMLYNLISDIRLKKLPNPDLSPNAGSFFKNPVVEKEFHEELLIKHPDLKGFSFGIGYKLSAAKLIDKAGWKGKGISSDSKAKVSQNHALVIIGTNGVTQKEIIELSEAIIDDVNYKFGITLEREVSIIK